MRFLSIASSLSAAVFVSAYPVSFATDVGMAYNFGEADYYGRLDLDGYPPPALIFRQPIAIDRTALGKDERKPIYLRVRPNQAQHWRRHCVEYAACNELILFVRETWYNREYVPRYQKNHPDRPAHTARTDDGSGQGSDDRRVQLASDHCDDGKELLSFSAISP
jgi:hypothetical protein